MRAGLGKKVGELVYATLGLLTKYALGINSISIFITGYICFMEVMSLVENCDKLGVPMPEILKKKVNNIGSQLGIDNNKDTKE